MGIISNDMRSLMRLCESVAHPTLYHGSRRFFPPGTVLKPQRGGYVRRTGGDRLEKKVGKLCEAFLERYRPADAVSRVKAVFMVDDPKIIMSVGGYDDHVYVVEPQGPVTRCNLYWYSELESYCWAGGQEPDRLDPYDTRRMARSYWNADPNDIGEPWRDHIEYLAETAVIQSRVD